jgi:predicted acylesterase/phospholipase RssA
MTKRAICLAGGGPAAGLHIGALEGLKDCDIEFNQPNSVWALSCIGAWVGVVYNQANKDEAPARTKEFFRGVFRENKSFESFPINTIFSPDWFGNAEAVQNFLLEPKNYRNAFLPREIMKSFLYTMSAIRRMGAVRRRKRGDLEYEEYEEFSEGDFNRWILNHVLAVNPAVRFLTAMVYKSEIDGLAKLFYPDSRLLKQIDFDNLNTHQYGGKKNADEIPSILYNAWNLSKKELQLFTNKRPPNNDYNYKRIGAASLCACSALPYIEQTVTIDGDTYCEGALRDTVNFQRLLQDHHTANEPLDEIWINRIVDAQQIRKPINLHDALANLCEMFAATVGEDDVRLFKYHVKELACNAIVADQKAREAEIASKGAPEDTGKQEAARKLREAADKAIAAKKAAFKGTIVEIKVDSKINFEWNHKNLDEGIERGRTMARATHRLYKEYKNKKKQEKPDEVLMIPDDLTADEIRGVLKDEFTDQIDAVLVGHPSIRDNVKRENEIIAGLGPPWPP